MNAPPSTQAAGLEAVFQQLRPDLVRRARSMGASDDAEDVVQDVWLKLQTATSPVSNPRAYLFRIVYTAVLDRRRGQRRTARRETDWLDGVQSGETVAPEAERAVIARETLQAVETRLQDLGDPAAAIFRLHRIEGRTQRRIADDLGMGLSTVEKHLRRAYAALLDIGDGQ